MRAFAPGKLVLTGAYAVLHGAPSIAVAVSRGAVADSSTVALSPTPEVVAALGPGERAPFVDLSAMFLGDRKIGLGASAAGLVASLATRMLDTGDSLEDLDARAGLFSRARKAHAQAQQGGSGVDVAASVYGGMIRYAIDEPVRSIVWPEKLVLSAFACPTSAVTRVLRGAVDALARRSPHEHRSCLSELTETAHEGADAAIRGDAQAFVGALRKTARGLARLGEVAGVPIVPAGVHALEQLASTQSGAFVVSGAGGGDVAVHVGFEPPSASFLDAALALGLASLPLSIDVLGVRSAPDAAVPSDKRSAEFAGSGCGARASTP